MKIYPAVVLLRHVFRVKPFFFQRVCLHDACGDRFLDLGEQLLDGTYAFFLFPVLGPPDRERGTPVPASGKIPVLDILEPFPETPGPGGLRLP